MVFEIRYSSEAVQQLKKLRKGHRATILDRIETVLTINPTLESKAKIKKLRQPAPTQFRFRIGNFRLFYDVEENLVDIIQILSKADALEYLKEDS